MIRVTFEVVDVDNEDNKETLSVVEIKSQHSSSKLTGEDKFNYYGWWMDTDGVKHTIQSGTIFHDRRNVFLFLVYKVLHKALKSFHYVM